MSYLRYGITTGRKSLRKRGRKTEKKQLKTYILFRFHKFFIMYRTLGDFAVEKPQNTTFHVLFISKHLPVGEAPH